MNGTLQFDQHRPATGRLPDSRELAIEARGLAKHYRNPWTLKITRGVEALDLTVSRGEVVGYLGPNGAGKTTTLKLLMGLMRPTSGHAEIFGRSIADPESRRRVGFLPEQPYFYDYLNGTEYLELAAGLSGLPGREASTRARHWLGRVGLGDRPRLGLRKYSKGMLQRLGLAAALVHEPDLLVLDEPMSGLDPFGRRDVRELILEQRERGVTVLFSSHILPDVEMLCDRVAIVLAGRLQRVATVADLIHSDAHAVVLRCAGHPLVEIPAGLADQVTRLDRHDETQFMLQDSSRLDEMLGWALHAGVRIEAVTPQRASLEDLFMSAAGAASNRQERRTA